MDTARQTFDLPTEQEFINIVNDFWYHCIWTVKKLKRGELWSAKFCMDSYMKWKLLAIVEYHAKAIHGMGHNTWHSGRFIEEWDERRVFSRSLLYLKGGVIVDVKDTFCMDKVSYNGKCFKMEG